MFKKLLKVELEQRNWLRTIIWWEKLRIVYNLIMGLVGILCMLIVYVSIPLIYILIALLLNAIYTFGWITELLVIRKTFTVEAQKRFPGRFFIVYLGISIILVAGFQLWLIGV